MKKSILPLIGFMLLVISCNKQDAKSPYQAQEEQVPEITARSCGAYEVLQSQIAADPGLAVRMQQIEDYTSKVLKNPATYRLVGDVIEIPVVVHVVYRTAAENISDAQVQSQIDVLNEDYQNTNPDKAKLPANSFQNVVSSGLNIRFVLAQTIHKLTKTKSWATNDDVKFSSKNGDDAVSPSNTLNIWACNLGKSLLGYAQFPGGNASTDGVVILYSAFGSRAKYPSGVYSTNYDLGRTATHEVGHWLNLRHIWGDDNGACSGSDLIDDTPNQGSENYGNPTYPHVSCSNAPKGDMFMNYMDYTNDKSMFMFSSLQKDRMLAIFAAGSQRASFR